MSFHNWGDVDKQGRDICYEVEEASMFIGEWLRKYARMSIFDWKEKFGTVRVYCSFGWSQLHSIFYPGYHSIQWPEWMAIFDLWFSSTLGGMRLINWLVIPIQKKLYKMRYAQCIKKWPHLTQEILCCADWHDELEGL